MKKSLISVVIALAILLVGCGESGQVITESTPTPFPTPVRPTFTVERGDIAVEAKLSGRVSPLALHFAYFQISGQVREVYANVNDVVSEGQLLAELTEAQELRAKSNETQRVIRRAQIDLEIAKLTLEQYRTQGRPDAEVKIQELKVELAQMNFDEMMESMGIDPTQPITDELDAQVAQARVFAPADGTIISAVTIGRNINETTPAFILGDPNQLEVVADYTVDGDVKEMYEGMPVIVIVDARDGVELTGKIRQLPSPYGTGPSEERTIHVVLDEAPSATTYQSGDKVTVSVTLASKPNILWLPPKAIRSAGGRTFVIVNSDSGPQRVDIEIGLQTFDMVEVVSGLEEGQVVVGP
jgi:RND family efflux transporter MFP subunit